MEKQQNSKPCFVVLKGNENIVCQVIDWRSAKTRATHTLKRNSKYPLSGLFVTQNLFALSFGCEAFIGSLSSSFSSWVEMPSSLVNIAENTSFQSQFKLAMLYQSGKIHYYDSKLFFLGEETSRLPPNGIKCSRFLADGSNLYFLIDNQLWSSPMLQPEADPKLHASENCFCADIRLSSSKLLVLYASADLTQVFLVSDPFGSRQELIKHKVCIGFRLDSIWITTLGGSARAEAFMMRDVSQNIILVTQDTQATGFLVSLKQLDSSKIRAKLNGRTVVFQEWDDEKERLNTSQVLEASNYPALPFDIDKQKIEGSLADSFFEIFCQKNGADELADLVQRKKRISSDLDPSYTLKNLEKVLALIHSKALDIQKEITPQSSLSRMIELETADHYEVLLTSLNKLHSLLIVCNDRKEAEAKENTLSAHQELGLPVNEYMEQDLSHLSEYKSVSKLISQLTWFLRVLLFLQEPEFKQDFEKFTEAISKSWKKRKNHLKEVLGLGVEGERLSFCELLFRIIYPVPYSQLPGFFFKTTSKFKRLLALDYISRDLAFVSKQPFEKYSALLQKHDLVKSASSKVFFGVWLCDHFLDSESSPSKEELKKVVHLMATRPMKIEWERHFVRVLSSFQLSDSLFLYTQASAQEWGNPENVEFYISILVHHGLLKEALALIRSLPSRLVKSPLDSSSKEAVFKELLTKFFRSAISSKKAKELLSLALSNDEQEIVLENFKETLQMKEYFLFSLFFREARPTLEEYYNKIIIPGCERIPKVEEVGKLIIEKGTFIQTGSQLRKEFSWLFASQTRIEEEPNQKSFFDDESVSQFFEHFRKSSTRSVGVSAKNSSGFYSAAVKKETTKGSGEDQELEVVSL